MITQVSTEKRCFDAVVFTGSDYYHVWMEEWLFPTTVVCWIYSNYKTRFAGWLFQPCYLVGKREYPR